MNIFRGSKIENVKCENQVKFVQERILSTEEKLASLCSTFGSYLQKNCRLRDASDDIAKIIFKYGTDENVNKTLKISLLKLAECIATIGDMRENEIRYLEENVINEFLQYNALCKNAKSQIKSIFSAKETEHCRRRYLSKIRQRSPLDRKVIIKAECELSKAAAESSKVQQELEEHIEIFERKKILDVKTILMNFVMGELRFHGECLQVYTEAYRILMDINVEKDLQAFVELLTQSPTVSRIEIVQKCMEPQNSTISTSKSQQSCTSEEQTIDMNKEVASLQEEDQLSEDYTSEEESAGEEEEEEESELTQINRCK